MMVYGGVWWCTVVYGGVWWRMVAYGGLWGCTVVYNSGRWGLKSILWWLLKLE